MAFGFGALPPQLQNQLDGMRPEDLARLFSPEMLGQPQGFGGSAGATLPTDQVEVPLPPRRPLSFGALPKSEAPPQQAPQADMPTPGAQPVMAPPLAPMPQPAAPAQPATPSAPEPSFGDTLSAGFGRFKDRGGFDLLGALGAGLLSSPTMHGGIAAGLQYADTQATKKAATDLARAEYGLKVSKLQRETQGENATKNYLLGKGFDDSLATAAMANPSVLSSVLAQMNKDPSIVTIGGNKYSLKPGEKPSDTSLLGPSEPGADYVRQHAQAQAEGTAAGQGDKDKMELLDTPEKRAAAGVQPTDTRTARLDAHGRVLYDSAPPAPTVHILEDENGNKHIRQFDPSTNRWIDPTQPPGAPPPPSNPLALKGKTTNDQAKAAGFSDRMLNSEGILAQNAGEGANVMQRALSGIPVVGGILGNYAASDKYQSYDQAKRDFINAQLRRESGAAIGKDEFTNAERQYFPQPGDSDATQKQKAVNRRTSIEAMIREGGTTYLPPKVFDESGALVPYGPGQRKPASNAPQQQGGMAIPEAAIQHLEQNPALREQFEAKYGRGTAALILGQ